MARDEVKCAALLKVVSVILKSGNFPRLAYPLPGRAVRQYSARLSKGHRGLLSLKFRNFIFTPRIPATNIPGWSSIVRRGLSKINSMWLYYVRKLSRGTSLIFNCVTINDELTQLLTTKLRDNSPFGNFRVVRFPLVDRLVDRSPRGTRSKTRHPTK